MDKLSFIYKTNLTKFLGPDTHIWTNYRDTHRTLDYIVTSPELLLRNTNIHTNNVHGHFETNHQAHLNLNHILIENSGAKRRKRHKNTQLILDREKNKGK